MELPKINGMQKPSRAEVERINEGHHPYRAEKQMIFKSEDKKPTGWELQTIDSKDLGKIKVIPGTGVELPRDGEYLSTEMKNYHKNYWIDKIQRKIANQINT